MIPIKYMFSLSLVYALLTVCCFNVCAQTTGQEPAKEIYRSKDLVIRRIAPNTYQHISFLDTKDFKDFPCNGLVVRDKDEVLIFDTPTNDRAAEELIKWVKEEMKCTIKAVIPTHFHDDCLGSLNAFTEYGVPSYGYTKTIAFAKAKGYPYPEKSFPETRTFTIGNEQVIVRFLGEGHTKDNVVGYFRKDQVLFGGCLVKEMNATKGFLGDANLEAWPVTVEKVKKTFPAAVIIVPGHGNIGDRRLLEYTISLFR